MGHLLTTWWSSFVNQKKLVAGDSIVFLRADNGDHCVGMRRAKRGRIGSPDTSGWNTGAGSYGGYSAFLRDDENRMLRGGGADGNRSSSGGGSYRESGKVSPKSVIEAAYLAATGLPFEVVYYPHANTPEFCVKASSVNASITWLSSGAQG